MSRSAAEIINRRPAAANTDRRGTAEIAHRQETTLALAGFTKSPHSDWLRSLQNARGRRRLCLCGRLPRTFIGGLATVLCVSAFFVPRVPVAAPPETGSSAALETANATEEQPQPRDDAAQTAAGKQRAEWIARRKRLAERIAVAPENVELYSQRGDLAFFLGDFDAALADYDRMIALNPRLSDSHWRRGIVLFYLARYKDAAAQFERYHSFDNIDRENGIWRLLSQTKAFGLKYAREQMLKYKQTDRPPFPDLYAMFAGKITPAEVRERIRMAELSAAARQARMFYAELYIGLFAAVQDDSATARTALAAATANPWPKSAGYGPNYMQHVGRLHLELLDRKAQKETKRRE